MTVIDEENKKSFCGDDYTVKIENGGQFLYYKGEKLPLQKKSVVVQDLDDFKKKICWATMTVRAVLSND